MVMQMIIVSSEYWQLFYQEIFDAKTASFYTDSYAVILIRLPCALALAFELHPKVKIGMEIMKFANN